MVAVSSLAWVEAGKPITRASHSTGVGTLWLSTSSENCSPTTGGSQAASDQEGDILPEAL